ncbi:2-succinyl-5-enolpyruvyl-6-hydroxy-3-cyclohexene-1-carboxylic-acid synthase [Gracilibacillus alcaliphilus]|uniref:2-succinyl-5-enolpyruvyl-6-hydroxy-3- cyclohexene-1-carboxylic-acid synthase n=1 Tax=Gracilibacillus alcaliphilus TaxID=1401441 RepID=UPI00195968FB|nr:2-succinyl-5-enolpyruvyl-6-hydroxy-3-cyclohexene-1-carboxylic-acid synthase [Gracilibacillus alcaliphilus]MBM7675857.1 2-succinyl-5-enolpyruvyl-6-hydroxy-3-cyclohexene-1-carboxylate synthase [Gracilibacillus alcaliphilus]
MSSTTALTAYIGNFTDQLYKSGVRDIVISPGSRSTPLSLTFAAYSHFQLWVDIDERSAAYFALGIAKETKRPVVLICSSGTAAANYFPAVIEAAQQRVPLIVLTADRPHELRDVGAAQAIDQIKLFGSYVKWFHEMALPESTTVMRQYARNHADRAVQTAQDAVAGPVHLNFPFREPLIPDFQQPDIWGYTETSIERFPSAHTQLDSQTLLRIKEKMTEKESPVIVIGPHSYDGLAEAVIELAETWHIPVFADPLSLARLETSSNVVIDSYDSILKRPQVRQEVSIDLVIRFGAMPVSKAILQLLQEQTIEQLIIDEVFSYRNPAVMPASYLQGNPVDIAKQLTEAAERMDNGWLSFWQQLNLLTKEVLADHQEELTEGTVVQAIADQIPADSSLFAGNSMPIRDIDTFWFNSDKRIAIHANRGANGIDGVVSTALGMATTGKRVTLLIGDISFLHSMNGLLLTKRYLLNVTIVLINNNGGGIFSFLPQAKQKTVHYEQLFGTPQQIDMEHAARLYDLPYVQPHDWPQLNKVLAKSYRTEGVSLIEVVTNRDENVQWHQVKWQQIEKLVHHKIKGEPDVY